MGTQKRLITYDKDGNSLEGQRLTLLSAYPTSLFYQEAYTGMTTYHPELSKILAKIKRGDTLVVTRPMMILLLVLIFPVAVLWEVMKRANGKKPRKKDKWKL